MISDRQRSEMVGYWWAKARDSLASARREFDAGAYSFAMNRLYCATFYGVCAALIERKQSFKKHSGVRAAFHRQFIKTGLLDRIETEWIPCFSWCSSFPAGSIQKNKEGELPQTRWLQIALTGFSLVCGNREVKTKSVTACSAATPFPTSVAFRLTADASVCPE